MKKILIGLVGLVFLLLIVGGMLVLRIDSRWAAKVAAIRAAGQPTSLADLKPAPLPSGQNAAAELAAVAAQVDAFSREQQQFSNTPAGKAYEETAREGAGPNAEQAAAMRTILERYADIATAATRAAALDRFQFDLDYSLNASQFIDAMLEHVQRFRGFSRYLAWRIRLSAVDGQTDEAVRRGIEMLKIARLQDETPTIVSHMLSIAVGGSAIAELSYALASGTPSPQSRAALDAELFHHDTLQPLGRAVEAERAFALSAIDDLGSEGPPIASRFLLWKPKGDLLSIVEHFDVMLPAAVKPWHATRAAPGGTTAFSTIGLGALANTFIPTVNAAYEASNRRVAVVRCLRVLNAMQAFKEAHGREAHGLHELNLPAETTIDPFSGKPLIVKPTDRGWLVYSVYRNGKDDGGIFDGFKDAGVGPPRTMLEAADGANVE